MIGNATCASGYTGPLCSVCSNNYFASGKSCTKCDNRETLNASQIFFIILLCSFGLAAIIYVYHAYVRPYRDEDKDKDEEEKKKVSRGEVTYLWLQMRFQSILIKIKIMVATFQVRKYIYHMYDVKVVLIEIVCLSMYR